MSGMEKITIKKTVKNAIITYQEKQGTIIAEYLKEVFKMAKNILKRMSEIF